MATGRSKVPVPTNEQPLTGLEGFAASIERRLQAAKKTGGPFAAQRLVCRLMTSKNEKIAAYMIAKWVSWRYGNPKETHEHIGEGGGPIVHTIRFGNGNSDR